MAEKKEFFCVEDKLPKKTGYYKCIMSIHMNSMDISYVKICMFDIESKKWVLSNKDEKVTMWSQIPKH